MKIRENQTWQASRAASERFSQAAQAASAPFSERILSTRGSKMSRKVWVKGALNILKSTKTIENHRKLNLASLPSHLRTSLPSRLRPQNVSFLLRQRNVSKGPSTGAVNILKSTKTCKNQKTSTSTLASLPSRFERATQAARAASVLRTYSSF